MQRKVSPSLLDRYGSNVKSSFISTYSPEHREHTTQLTSRKHLSSSTFHDLQESKATFAVQPKLSRNETKFLPHANQITRARSARNIEDPKFKSLQVIQQAHLGLLNENTLRLKAEELLFKLKVRFGSLLKEMGVKEEEALRFSLLGKADEVILFVTDSVRKRLKEASSIASTTSTSISKDREALGSIERELEQAKSRLAEREGSQRLLKGKLKQCRGELKELYDRVNIKEKEYSQRTTEIYQLKVQMKQQEKSGEVLKGRVQALEKERNQLKCMLDSAGKGQLGMLGTLKQENQQLVAQLAQTRQQVTRIKQRCTKLQQLNQHLNEQLTRWRERVDFEGQRQSDKQKSSQQAPHTPNDLTGVSLNELKKSTMSMNSAYISKFNSTVRLQSLTALEIDNTRLKLQLAQIQKEKEQLQRTLLNYAPLKMKYEQALEGLPLGHDLSSGIDGKRIESLKQGSGQLQRAEMESHYKRKTEQIASQWKDKLYDIVCKYEDERQLLKNQINTAKHERQIAQKKLCNLANEKYFTQTKLIQLEKELYSVTNRSSKSLLSFAHEDLYSQEKYSNARSPSEDISSHPILLPILEEEPPHKLRQEDASDNLSVFNVREGEAEGQSAPPGKEDTL